MPSPRDLVVLADDLMRQRRWDEAEAPLRAALAIEPDAVIWRFRLATCLTHQPARRADCLAEYRTILAQEPGHLRARYDLLGLLFKQRLWGEMEEVAAAGLAAAPDDRALALRHAQAIDARTPRDETRRIHAWRHALESDPASLMARRALATALDDFDRVDEARAIFDAAGPAARDDPTFTMAHARFLISRFEYDAAFALGCPVARVHPRAEAIIFTFSRLLQLLHRHDEARAMLDWPAADALPGIEDLRRQADICVDLWAEANGRWHAGEGAIADRVRAFLATGDLLAAHAGALAALAETDGSADAVDLCYETYWLSGADYMGACSYFAAQAVRRDPNDHRNAMRVAGAFLRAGKHRVAVAMFVRLSRHGEGRPMWDSLLNRIGIMEFSGRRAQAAALLDEVIASDDPRIGGAFRDFCRVRRLCARRIRGEAIADAHDAALRAAFPAIGRAEEHLDAIAQRRAVPATVRAAPSVALCISGKLRGYAATWPTIRAMIAEPLQADIFLSTWDNVGTEGGLADLLDRFLPERLKRALPVFMRNTKAFARAFPATVALLQQDEPVDGAALPGQLGLAGCDIEAEADFDRMFDRRALAPKRRNACKMLYKIDRADGLMRQHAARTGKRYDLVIRLRPDMAFTKATLPPVVAACLADPAVIGATVFKASGIEDQMAFGSPEAMGLYASIWPNVAASGGSHYLPYFDDQWSEGLLRHHLIAHGLSFHQARGFEWQLRQRTLDPDILLETMLSEVSGADPMQRLVLSAFRWFLREARPQAEEAARSRLDAQIAMIRDRLEPA